MATGTGKTHTFAQLPDLYSSVLPGKMLVLAHREELIDQAIAKLRLENPLKRIDKEKAEHVADPSQADIVVASVASMTPQRMEKYDWTKFDKFVIDEAHHSTADTYTRVLEAAGLMVVGSKKLLTGWTATPQRGDGEALAKVYKKIAYTYSIREAIADGWLVDIKGIRVKTGTDISRVKSTAGDYNQGQLADAVNNPARNKQAVNVWKERAQNRQTIGFCVNIQHAQDMAAMFSGYGGIPALAVWGDDPMRAEKLELFRLGEIKVLFNCGILTEGFDMWQVGCILNAAPTKSPVKYVQCVGRGTRLQEGTGNLHEFQKNALLSGDLKSLFGKGKLGIKEDCIVIDLVDNCQRNSLVTLPTLMGLPNTLDLDGKSLYQAVKEMEEATAQFPGLDLSELENIGDLQTFIQDVNLFDVPFKPEVLEGSDLCWQPSSTGGYVINLPNKDWIKIKENLLDKFDLTAVINGKKHAGERPTLAEAFAAADNLIITKRADAIGLVKREAAWHNVPATPKQISTLKKFYPGRQIPPDLDKGKASRLIGAHIAGMK